MAKAKRLFASVSSVDHTTRLINAGDAGRLIATADALMTPCTPAEAAFLVAELIAAYPQLAMMRADKTQDFQLYSIKLHEAFRKFSKEVGKAVVHGGDGIPGKVAYKPQASDVMTFGNAEVEKIARVKTMAMRHRAESDRRRDARLSEPVIDEAELQRRRERVNRLNEEFKRAASSAKVMA